MSKEIRLSNDTIALLDSFKKQFNTGIMIKHIISFFINGNCIVFSCNSEYEMTLEDVIAEFEKSVYQVELEKEHN